MSLLSNSSLFCEDSMLGLRYVFGQSLRFFLLGLTNLGESGILGCKCKLFLCVTLVLEYDDGLVLAEDTCTGFLRDDVLVDRYDGLLAWRMGRVTFRPSSLMLGSHSLPQVG